MIDPDLPDLKITIDNNQSTIQRLSIHDKQKYVGITTSPSGDINHPIQALKKICNTFIYDINRANITREDMDIAFRTMFLPKLFYQLTLYSLPEKQLNMIQQTYEKHVVSRSGYCNTWPKELRYGTHHIHSLRLPNLHLEQTASQINLIHRFLTNTHTNKLIENVFDMFHLQAGTQYDPFEKPQVIHHTDSKWIQQFISALKKYNISIIRSNRIQFPVQR